MDVGGLHQPQVRLTGRGERRERVKDRQRADGRSPEQERPAVDLKTSQA